MAGNRNQKLKLLYLMKMFQEETDEQHPMSMPQILSWLRARGLEAERRSIYDDIELLRDFGMDIVMNRSRTCGYFLGSRAFELPELKLLVDTVQASRFITNKKSQMLIKKIEALASRHQAKTLQRQVYVAGRIKTMNESIYYNVDALHKGITENKQISFQYFEYALDKQQHFRRNGERYVVSPFLLSWDNENYYLVAYHERYHTLAHFRIDKMASIRIEDQPRVLLEEGLDPVAYCQSTFGMYSGKRSDIRVEFAAGLIGVVIDRFGKDVSIQPSREGWFIAYLHVSVSPVFLSWLFQFGEKARILGPAEVRERMLALLEETLSEYRRDPPPEPR